MRTIATLCRSTTTMNQFTILMRADVVFAGSKQGRYFGGLLSDAEVSVLTDGLKMEAE
jgi:hypothetical protein